MTLQTSAHKV